MSISKAARLCLFPYPVGETVIREEMQAQGKGKNGPQMQGPAGYHCSEWGYLFSHLNSILERADSCSMQQGSRKQLLE